jgi:hypothetical protein
MYLAGEKWSFVIFTFSFTLLFAQAKFTGQEEATDG